MTKYTDRSNRSANPEGDAEAEAKVVAWAQSGEPWGSRRHPEFKGDDARAQQAASREVMRIDKAVAKFIREGLTDDDFKHFNIVANKRAEHPPDQAVLVAKLGVAVEQMVNLIITGEVTPRSAAEAAGVAEALVRIAGTIKIDGAALAAAVVMQGEATDRHEQFRRLLADHRAALEEKPKP